MASGTAYVATSLVLSVAIASCTAGAPRDAASLSPSGASASAASPSPTRAPTPTASATAVAALVGEWVATHDCEQIYSMLHSAGFDEFIPESIYGNELVPGVPPSEAELRDPENPCAGAVPRGHSHFFTENGRFGSRDFGGGQVDDGSYELVGDNVVEINGSRFRYSIDGDELMLDPEPVDVSDCTTKECRFEGVWVLMVALPGTTWTRSR